MATPKPYNGHHWMSKPIIAPAFRGKKRNKMPTKPEQKRFDPMIRNMDRDLWRQLRVWCLENRMQINAAVTIAVTTLLKGSPLPRK